MPLLFSLRGDGSELLSGGGTACAKALCGRDVFEEYVEEGSCSSAVRECRMRGAGLGGCSL